MTAVLINRLGLNKLFLWSEATRFQTYPQALARLQPGRAYTRQQIAEELFGLAAKGDGRQRRESQINNLFGMVQVGHDKLLLKGINLFQRITPHGVHRINRANLWEQVDDKWEPTQSAQAIGIAYDRDPNGLRWRQLLAEQLARYEPRTRVLLHLLGQNYHLRFAEAGYFTGNTFLAQIVGPQNYSLFAEQGAAFNQLLYERLPLAIGPWWIAQISAAGFDVAPNYVLQGAMNRPPSTNYINSALKTALYVFHDLHILQETEAGWRVDPEAFARHIHPEVGQELLGLYYAAAPDPDDEWGQLAHLIAQLTDEQGFVAAAMLADKWGALQDIPPAQRAASLDAFIRQGIFTGRVDILDQHLGQPRLGRGLFDDDNLRLVKLRILTAV
ncbi:MAG: hypothetical protein IPM39_19390 [Chloroflexi bacterium]|nr:hypothetical protein [Chloroflexota bacterium]